MDWSHDALWGAFLGGLQPELVMFESQYLDCALSLTRMKDEQLQSLG